MGRAESERDGDRLPQGQLGSSSASKGGFAATEGGRYSSMGEIGDNLQQSHHDGVTVVKHAVVLCDEQFSRRPRSGAMATSSMDRGIWES